MTVRVTTLKGADPGGYYVEHLPNYYLDSGEPRGIWIGDAAQMLGLSGELDDDAFLAVMAGMDPQRPDRSLGRAFDDNSVRGFDVTASAPKSVSVLWALGDDTVRRAVLAAHDTAVRELALWIEDHAHTRYRIGGQVAVVDAKGIVAATFRQHTSRALDPQLHTHLVISNRVKSPDGRWLALDARLIKRDQQTLSALYHVTLRSELSRRLGVRWEEPEHGISEIANVSDGLRAEFSTRTAAVARRIDEKLDRFVETMEREPTVRERWRLEREAVTDSRPAKPHSSNAENLHAGWIAQARRLGLEPRDVVDDAIDQVESRQLVKRDEMLTMMDRALGSISDKQSSWRPTEMLRELAATTPTDVGVAAHELVGWLQNVTDHVTTTHCIDISKAIPPNALLRMDGRPVSESVVDRALTTRAILDQEATIVEWLDRRLAHNGFENPAALTNSSISLNAAQAEAAAAVAGTEDVVLIVGPAGTGKTTALAPAVAQLRSEGRTVFGVAPSATAAEVLSDETGVAADTLDKLLIEHRLNRPPDHRYNLPVGATVVVDEAGMMPTAKLAELADLADLKGWRVVLVGDPLQFSAVGRGGMFGLLVDSFGAIELEQVHRFDNEWEREASLRLRRGDVTVAEVYEEHGRLHHGTLNQMERASVDAWWKRRQAGDRGLLMSPTNEAAERLNVRCQQTRIQAGEIDSTARHIEVGPYSIYPGDEVATRANNRKLTTDRGDMIRNRNVWTVQHVQSDGSITVSGSNGTVNLPPDYVSEHVELAYARTVLGAQGRNVVGSVTLYDRATDVRNVYVAMSRGTSMNEAFFATRGEQTALDMFTQSIATDWIDLPAHARRAELREEQSHRAGLLDGRELRRLLEERFDTMHSIEHAEFVRKRLPVERRDSRSRLDRAEMRLADINVNYERAQNVLDRWDRPLHRRRHADDIAAAQRDVNRLPEQAQQVSLEVERLVVELAGMYQSERSAGEVLQSRTARERRVSEIDQHLSHDRLIRTRVVRSERSHAIARLLGDRPAPGAAAQEWDIAAGQLAQHQAAFDIESGLGPRPKLLDNDAYTASRASIERNLEPVRPSRHVIERDVPSIGLSR